MTEASKYTPSPVAAVPEQRSERHDHRLRRTLQVSQREAVSSSVTIGITDNFLTAFAIHLQATVPQIAWLTAIPQLIGAWLQVCSIWLGLHLRRQWLIIAGVAVQSTAVLALALIALLTPPGAVRLLITTAVIYHTAANFIQPHWRALMGGLVPERRRGRFFAHRTRIAMLTSFIAFLIGGHLLNLSAGLQVPGLGFTLLFVIAFGGRSSSAWLISRMHDPIPHGSPTARQSFEQTWLSLRSAVRDRTFRDYSLFLAGMQGMVAISAPFFSVYMLRVLGWSYLQFTVNVATSILVQFLTLRAWGRVSDHLGNRVVIIFTSLLIPMLPALWILWDGFWYLLLVQVLSGFAWSGFNLSTSNYLYDLRPHHTHFASYVAVQAGLSASAVFCGALAGGLLAGVIPSDIVLGGIQIHLARPLLGIFAVSSVLRLLVALWFLPRAQEPRVRRRPQVRELIYRIARYTPISGVALDWLTITHKQNWRGKQDSESRR